MGEAAIEEPIGFAVGGGGLADGLAACAGGTEAGACQEAEAEEQGGPTGQFGHGGDRLERVCYLYSSQGADPAGQSGA